MSFTYSGDPNTSDLDAVRFLIGDTDPTNVEFQDAEINWEIQNEVNIYRAGSVLASDAAAKYSKIASKSVGDLHVQYGELAKNFEALSTTLNARSARRTAMPYAGGLEKADKRMNRLDTGIVQPTFRRNQFNQPRVSNNGPNVNPDSTYGG
jgi:uncharacterized protein YegL